MAKHVTIIGGGLAGVMAALAAKAKGAQVTLISGAPGATAFASGAWDIAEPVGDVASYTWENYPDALTCIEQIVRAHPRHPYTVIGRGEAAQVWSLLGEALPVLFERMPYQPQVDFKRQQVLLTPLGTVKITAIADPAQASGNLRALNRGRILIVGIPGLATFPVSLTTRLFEAIRKRTGGTDSPAVVADQLEIEGIPQHSLSPFALAERLEEDASLADCAKSLRALVRQHKASHVLLPPVMGIEKNAMLLERLRAECGVVCSETLSTVPSIPGLRRHRALETVLKSSGVVLVPDKVVGHRKDAKRVTHLILSNQGEDAPLEVEQVVLTSGRFLSGGLCSDGTMREAIFGLPVFVSGGEVGSTFIGKLVHRRYLSDHGVFTAGVAFDASLHPLNRWGEPLLENLRVAGSLLGGFNAAGDGAGSGVAILSGWVAGGVAAS